MNYRDTYMDFEWKRIEGERVSVLESPLDSLVRKEDMSQLAKAMVKLDKKELACVMLLHYGENSTKVSEIRNHVNTFKKGNDYSLYMIRKFEKVGLKKIRRELRNVFGWER